MLWRKREQVILWGTAYTPLVLFMVFRFIDSNNYFKKTKAVLWLVKIVNPKIIDVVIVLAIAGLSLAIYHLVANWLFHGLEQKLTTSIGQEVYVRKYEPLSVNDYSFFLMTLLVPLISMGFSSAVNLTITCLIIVIVVVIYVKTDTISVCPVIFLSGRHVYKGIVSDQPKEKEKDNPAARQEVVLITRQHSLNLDNKFRIVPLIGNIRYMSTKDSR